MGMEKVIEAIKRYDRYLIISHINMEGDSIGCQFAFKALLEALGKKAVIVNETTAPPQYDFLNIGKEIITDLNRDIDYEAVAVLDCPVIKRVGRASKFVDGKSPLINIDHHISNADFGDVNWVEPDASSCGEIVYKLFKSLEVPISNRAALFLYVAILTDTGSFAYENTTSATHIIVADLIDKGLEPHLIYQAIYENKTVPELVLLAKALSTIKTAQNGAIAYMSVSEEMLKKFGLGIEVIEGYINYARAIKSAEVAMIFSEDPLKKGSVHISFRSKGRMDVNDLASLFGGGGHKNASGCLMEGSIKDVMKKVLDQAELWFRRQ